VQSKSITDQIDAGILSNKPGWVRLSLHPTMTDAELDYILTAIEQVVEHAAEWSLDYEYDSQTNEYTCILDSRPATDVKIWFNMSEALVS